MWTMTRSSGFTLLELLLAVSLLTVLISLSVPSVTAILKRQEFQEVAGQVEVFLQDVRREAVMSGQPRWIRHSSGDRMLVSGLLGEPVTHSLQLPEGYEFSRCELAEPLATEQLGDLGLEAVKLMWSPEVQWYPDGTTDDLRFEVSNPDGRTFQFDLRGLTGQVKISRGTVPLDGGR